MTIGPGTRVHFLGVGGIGVSGLARLCAARGLQVSGCDIKLSGAAKLLEQHGAALASGHHPGHLDVPVDLVVYSAAVPRSEPELMLAEERGIPMMTRGQLLAALTSDRRLVAVAGAHGKTTTSGLAAELLLHAGWDPTVMVGGVMVSRGTNAIPGQGTYFVAETDESDGSFLYLAPEIAIVTNIDREHLNHYTSFERLLQAFQQFASQIRPDGTVIRCVDDPLVRRHIHGPRHLDYGLLDPSAYVRGEQVVLTGDGSTFRVVYRGRPLGVFELQVPGRHNVLNALSVIGLGLTLELPLATIRAALAGYQGTRRRFQVTRLPDDIWLVEDYAHHPSEIQATLAADTHDERRRLVVFQPHRYSRTQSLEQEFTHCFERADGVIVTDIYSAFETPIPGVSGERLAELMKAHGHPCVRYIPKQGLHTFITRMMCSGDTIFFLGAGDIGELCHELATELRPAVGAAR